MVKRKGIAALPALSGILLEVMRTLRRHVVKTSVITDQTVTMGNLNTLDMAEHQLLALLNEMEAPIR